MADNPLQVNLPRGVTLKDPVLLASGCCGYGEEYVEIIDPASIGGVITKAVSMEPRAGNEVPRLRETPSGLLNCIGLQNPGIKAFCHDHLPRISSRGYDFFINVVGHSATEFAAVLTYLESTKLLADCTTFKGYELDLSCPNVESGTQFATDLVLLAKTVSLCRAETEALLVAKLSPNVTDIAEFARISAKEGADAVTIANTWSGVSININSRCSNMSRPSAGLSGPAIRAATLYLVMCCKQALPELPILGSGGITDAESAIEFLLAGASVVQVGTGLFLNPKCPVEIRDGISRYLIDQQETSLSGIIGTYSG